MTWSYGGDPAANNQDAVRFLITDTDTNDQLVSNEELAWLLSENSDDVYTTAADAARQIARQFARQATLKRVDDLHLEYRDRAKTFDMLAAQLANEAQQRSKVPTPYGGGLSIDEHDTDAADNDLVQPRFRRGQFAMSDRGVDDLAPEFDEDGV